MNWGLILWFAGVVGTIYGLKFVLELFKSLLGKESRESKMETIGESIHSANKRITNNLKKKAAEKKKQKESEKRNSAIVTIR